MLPNVLGALIPAEVAVGCCWDVMVLEIAAIVGESSGAIAELVGIRLKVAPPLAVPAAAFCARIISMNCLFCKSSEAEDMGCCGC